VKSSFLYQGELLAAGEFASFYGFDFGLDIGQTLSEFFWVFDKDPRYKVSAFFEHWRWGFLQFLSSQQCSFWGQHRALEKQ